jgi:DNA-binding NtrC family response regulator
MPLETQGKVLRVLVDQTFLRVNGAKKVRVDIRIVSSTSRDLPSLITVGRFREDLYHRLGVIPVQVPGLVERREDIPELVAYFARAYSAASGQPLRKLADDAIAVLQTRDWAGNVRELRNNVERILILASGDAADLSDLARACGDRGGRAVQRGRWQVDHLPQDGSRCTRHCRAGGAAASGRLAHHRPCAMRRSGAGRRRAARGRTVGGVRGALP